MMGMLTRNGHLQGHLFKQGLVGNTWYVRWKQASEMVSCVLCGCKAPAVLRFSHLGHNLLTSGDFANISVTKVSALFLNCGAAERLWKGLQKKNQTCSRCKHHCVTCPGVFNSTFMLNVTNRFIN